MLGINKILILTFVVLTFVTPVIGLNIDLEITNQDYQIMRVNSHFYNKLCYDKDETNNICVNERIDKKIARNQKNIEMICNTAHTSKLNCVFEDKKNLKYTIVVKPESGKVKINSDGTFTYLPYIDFCGRDSFSFTVSNEKNKTARAHMIINVKKQCK